jgi:hypothetical protein
MHDTPSVFLAFYPVFALNSPLKTLIINDLLTSADKSAATLKPFKNLTTRHHILRFFIKSHFFARAVSGI